MNAQYGVQVVSDCANPIADIVFVHGFRGDSYRTWRAKKPTASSSKKFIERIRRPKATDLTTADASVSEVFWPRDLLPLDAERARVMTFGYDANIGTALSRGANNSIFDVAQDLIVRLQMRREALGGDEVPIIFVAHSLGGIVVKDSLKFSEDQKDFQPHLHSIFQRTHGIIFFGTPHRGSELASMGQLAAKIAGLGLKKQDSRLLQSLEQGSVELERIADSFSRMLPKTGKGLAVYSFQEGLPFTNISGKVVEPYSSIIGDAFEGKSTIHADHMGMCRFVTRDEPDYQLVLSVVKRWLSQIDKGKALMPNDITPAPVVTLPASQGLTETLSRTHLVPHPHEEKQLMSLQDELPDKLLPFTPHRNFQGRDTEITWLKDTFSQLAQQGVNQCICILYGMGGVGKTQIALRYAVQESTNYRAVFWINCASQSSVFYSFLEIAQQLIDWAARVRTSAVNFTRIGYEFGLGQCVDPTTGQVKVQDTSQNRIIIDAIRRWLSKDANSGWLLVFDSADDLETVNLQQYFPHTANGNIIVTSRQKRAALLGPSLEIQCFSILDATKLLVETSGCNSEEAEELGCLPLGIIQAASYLVITGSKPREYLDLFKNQKSRLLNYRPVKSAWSYEYTVFTTWEVSFAELSRQWPIAAHILLICGFLSPEDIPFELFVAAPQQLGGRAKVWQSCWSLSSAKHSRLRRLLGKAKVRENEDQISPGVLDVIKKLAVIPSHFSEVREAIFGLSLASPNATNDGFTIHPLVRSWCQLRDSSIGSIQLRVEAIIIAARIIDTFRYVDRGWHRISVHLDSCLSSLTHLQSLGRIPTTNMDFLYVMDALACNLGESCHEDALFVYQILYDCLTVAKGSDHILTLAVQGFLAREMQYTEASGDIPASEALARKTYTESFKALGADHPDTQTQAFNLAENLLLQGKYSEAAPLFKGVLEYRKTRERSLMSILQAEHGLAMCYGVQGNLHDGKTLLQNIIRILLRERTENLMLYTVYSNLAELYGMAGQLHQKELTLLERNEVTERNLGPTHFLTLSGLVSLASFYSGCPANPDLKAPMEPRQTEKAEVVYDHLFAMYDHLSLKLKGKLIFEFHGFSWNTGDLVPYIKHTKTMLEHFPHAEQTLYNKNLEGQTWLELGLACWDIGSLDQAADCLLESMKIFKTLNSSEADLLLAMSNQAIVYRDVGRPIDAEKLLQDSIKGEIKLRGTCHLLSQTNLATIYQAQGRHEEAMDLFTRTQSSMIEKLGDTHSNTLLNQHALACLHEAMGNVDEAIRIAKDTFNAKQSALGMDGPATMKTALFLGRLYRSQGLHEEVRELADMIRPFLEFA